jgi:hypothetical protein
MKKLILALAIGFLATTGIQAQSKEEGMIKDLVRIELSDKYNLSEDASYKGKTVQRAVLYAENEQAPSDGIQSQHVFELPVKGIDYQEGETYNPKNVSDALLEGIDAVYKKAGTNVKGTEIDKYWIDFVTVGEKRIAIVTLVNSKDPKQRVKEMNQQLGVDPDKLTGN